MKRNNAGFDPQRLIPTSGALTMMTSNNQIGPVALPKDPLGTAVGACCACVKQRCVTQEEMDIKPAGQSQAGTYTYTLSTCTTLPFLTIA